MLMWACPRAVAISEMAPGRFGIILPETDEIAAINYIERVRQACELWLESGAIALDLAAGWAKGGWEVELYARNLSDARGQQSRSARCNISYCGPSAADPIGEIYRIYIQPRTLGIRVGRKF